MSPSRRDALRFAPAAALWLAACVKRAPTRPPAARVAAGPEMRGCFDAVAQQVRQRGGHVATVYGEQVAREAERMGALDAVASTDAQALDALDHAGRLVAGTRVAFARGRLVVFSRAGALAQAIRPADLVAPAVRRVAMPDPERSRYGLAARESLTASGLWDALAPKLVLTDGADRALQLARAGDADAALTARSLVQAGTGRWAAIDAGSHGPIVHGIAALRGGPSPDGARLFLAALLSEASLSLLERLGFDPATP